MEKYRNDIKSFAKDLELELEDIADLFSEYLNEVKNYGNQLKVFLSEKDYTQLQLITHGIKGISGNMWIEDVFREADNFDKLLKTNLTSEANIHVNRLVLLIENSELRIRKVFAEENLPLK